MKRQMFRLIQSIPSPKAEPFKQWMAQVAAMSFDQMQDPELSIKQQIFRVCGHVRLRKRLSKIGLSGTSDARMRARTRVHIM